MADYCIGLAVFVFIDGQYQCNRNKLGLVLPEGEPEQAIVKKGERPEKRPYEVDFCLKQKEEKTVTGTFVGREWTFAELNTGKFATPCLVAMEGE